MIQTDSSARSYGIFFGDIEVHRELPGFSVSILAPTLRAEDVPVHTHQNGSFVLVLAGAYLSSADGAPSVCGASTLIFNPAGTSHRDTFKLASGRFLAVSISDRSYQLAAEGTALPSSAKILDQKHALTTAYGLAQNCAIGESEAPSPMEGLCWELLSNVAGRKIWAPQRLLPWVKRARELLHDRCNSRLCIGDMAHELGVHPVYFARGFRQAFGCTPGEYFTRCRMHKVMELLRGTNLPLSEIALQAGFFDQSHLTKAFRSHFGLAPHGYRNRLRRTDSSWKGSIHTRAL